jgi:hypothetical protein
MAGRIDVYLGRAVARLIRHGFSEDEALGFVAGIAYDRSRDMEHRWASPVGARITVRRIHEGRAAKDWSIRAIVLALFDIGELTGDPTHTTEKGTDHE